MEDNVDSPKLKEGRKTLKKALSITKEHRYDSLQSLSRLVEDDFKHEIETSRRVSLPTLNESALSPELTTGLWRRNSSVVDYMQELTSKRREMIQRLVPDVGDKDEARLKENGGGSSSVLCQEPETSNSNFRNNNQMSPLGNSYKSAGVNSPMICTDSDKMETSNNIEEDAVKILKERIAKFESMKSTPRSIHADDFQQFLGARYLEIYQKRARRNHVIKDSHLPHRHDEISAPQNDDMKDSSQGRNSRSLNAKIHSIARHNHERLRNINGNLKVTLPPIMKDSVMDRKDLVDKKRTALELNAKYQHGFTPIHNDLSVGNLERCHVKGIPHHTAKRANKRYHESREINLILNELRQLSSTVQKSEQEDFVHRLEDDD